MTSYDLYERHVQNVQIHVCHAMPCHAMPPSAMLRARAREDAARMHSRTIRHLPRRVPRVVSNNNIIILLIMMIMIILIMLIILIITILTIMILMMIIMITMMIRVILIMTIMIQLIVIQSFDFLQY